MGEQQVSDSTSVFVAAAPSYAGHDAPQRLLLVEDSPEYALLTEQLLHSHLGAQVEVRVCESLAAADRALSDEEPDCVLLDLSLPDVGGLEAVTGMHSAAPEVPIVVLSGSDDEALAVLAVKEGAQDYLVKHRVEADMLVRAIRYAIERKQSELMIARQALVDPLTGLPNRAVLVDRLHLALARVERSDDCLAVLFVDLDRFKIINDSLGHLAGDDALREVAKRLVGAVRPSDTVVRFGGDEFVVLCDGVGSQEQAERVAERICKELAQPLTLGERELVVAGSIGIAFSADQSVTGDQLIRVADQAMFRAKQRGSSWELAGPATGALPSRGLEIQAELRRALERVEFQLHYQPQMDLLTQRVSGVEALLRWKHPQRGLVLPDEFIPEAEQSGLIVAIGEWVIAEACRQLGGWRRAGLCEDELVMSLNLSPRQLADKRLVDIIDESLTGNAIPPERLCLEITESTVAADPERAARTLLAIKELGAQLAIDDFGTGHSSLAVLARHPLDVLKIDQSFVVPLGVSLRPRRLFGAIVGVARALTLGTVAEGIERQEQLAAVAEVGCGAAQGFLLARPAPGTTVGPSLRLPLAAM